HNPLPKFVPNTQDYVVNARIQHRTGILFADVYYATDTIDGGDFQTVSMTLSDADNHIWTANIPAQTSGDEVFYYISAFAGDGKFQSRPIVAPAGTYSTKVVEEVVGVEDVLPTTSTFELGDIYPNPSQGLTVIPITSPATGKVVITLHNILGQSSYLAHAGILKEGEQNIFINTLGLGSGIYTVEILFEGEKQVQQLVIGR
ncbi:MAG: T9SS type A sorting domain-containing protein, partial [Chitinophagales bacterium]